MAKSLHRLTVKEIDAAASGSALSDGGGLLYRSGGKGQGKFGFKFTSPDANYRAAQAAKGAKSIQREQGLGSYPQVSLAQARQKAAAARDLLARGIDPIADQEAKQLASMEAATAKAEAPTLGEYADATFLPDILEGLKNAAHRQQWVATFKTHFAPLRDKKLGDVTKKDVLDTLKPLWSEKYITAKRSRERLERLFNHAEQNHAFEGKNPAELRHFNVVLTRPKSMAKGSHAAIPHSEIAAFIAALRLRQGDSLAALMVEFIALTACRTGEARFAVWSEIDFDKAIWQIPSERMKMKVAHVVPLVPRAMEILGEAKARHPASQTTEGVRADDYVFATGSRRALSEMAALMLLRRMDGYKKFTIHGLRATFKSWARTETEFQQEVVEEALAHKLDEVEGAYVRTPAVERRRILMLAWTAHLEGMAPAGATVVQLRAANGGQA